MDFNYAFPTYEQAYWATTYRPYSHKASVTYAAPPFQIVPECHTPVRPFEEKERLLDRMFREDKDREAALDPLNFPGERARHQDRQIHLLLDHLAARHAISYQIRKDIDYQEAQTLGNLDEILTWPIPIRNQRRVTDLEKQLADLAKERWAEEVTLWRDTGRVLTDVCDHWTEYAEHSRRGRLMDFDL
jgi:hypothetical protein